MPKPSPPRPGEALVRRAPSVYKARGRAPPVSEKDSPFQRPSVDARSAVTEHAESPDAVADLESSLSLLDEKLGSNAGVEGLAVWLREIEETIAALEDGGLDRARGDIRTVIDDLLGINAELQNVVRLKKLLS